MPIYQTGALPSPIDLRNYRFTAKVDDLPQAFSISHSAIKNQGNVQSCVAHSLSEILETKDNITYSTGWIYGYRPQDYFQGQGMRMSDALKTITKVGYLPQSTFAANVEMNKAKELVDKKLDEYKVMASRRRAAAYAQLKSIDEIKRALWHTGTPVVVCIKLDKDGLKLDDNFIAEVPQNPTVGHATVCYGWNKIGLLLQNSWGQNWGDGGTFILPYEYAFRDAWLVAIDSQIDYETIGITRPKYYWLREFVMKIVKFVRRLKS